MKADDAKRLRSLEVENLPNSTLSRTVRSEAEHSWASDPKLIRGRIRLGVGYEQKD